MDRFEQYLRISKNIEGWFDPDAARIIAFLNDLQIGFVGNIFEIGVHHGKMTLLLGQFVKKNKEILIVNDIFDMQDLNVSCSGRGSEAIFLTNFTKFFKTKSFLKVIRKSSLKLTKADTTNNCRIFSMDGGHSSEETHSDLTTAKNALNKYGTIIVDDYFNSGYPGVSEGVCRFLLENKDIQPWIYCFNKFIFRKSSSAKFYDLMLKRNHFEDFCKKNLFTIERRSFFGSEVLVFRKWSGLRYRLNLLQQQFTQTKFLKGFSQKPLVRRIYSLFHKFPKG